MGLFVKLLTNTFENASRDKRELSVVRELGCQVLVIAKGDSHNKEIVDGYEVHLLSTRPLGKPKFFLNLNRYISILTWSLYLRRLKADFVSCHDLIALLIAWISTIGKKKKTVLIYDAHEFEAGRNTGGKRGKFNTWLIIRLERYLVKRTDCNMMVNETIAKEVQRLHRLEYKPLVIRNLAPQWTLDVEKCKSKRIEFCHELDIPQSTFLIMYHGVVTAGRGIESVLQAIALVENTALVVLGNGEASYFHKINDIIRELQLEKKVLFIPAVPYNMLSQYIGAVDLGMVLIENTCLSYYYSLPNKLFENIQSLTPIIGSNFPEIRQIVEGFKVGICCEPSDPRQIAESIEILRVNKDQINTFKRNLIKAKSELTWEKEKIKLEEAYSILFKIIDNHSLSLKNV